MPSQQLTQFVPYLILFGFIWVSLSAIFLHRRWKRNAPSFDIALAREVAFDERWTTGWSERTSWSRHRGANRSLHVTIADGELWVRPHLPFRWIDRELELTLKAPIAEISVTKLQKSDIRVEFSNTAQTAPVVLRLRKAESFLAHAQHVTD